MGATASATRIQDQNTIRRASVVPLLSDPTKNGLVVCNRDGSPISGGGGSQKVPLSNTAWVNFGIASSDTTLRIFKTYDEAITWIQANGTPATTPRKVELPGGNVGDICLYSNIYISGDNGTTIDTLTSDTTFAGYNDILSTMLENVVISHLALTNGKCIYIKNCLIYDVIPVPASGTGTIVIDSSYILGGDFTGYDDIIGYWNCKFAQLTPISNLSGTFQNCDISSTSYVGNCNFYNCTIQMGTITTGMEVLVSNSRVIDNVVINSGGQLTLENSVCKYDVVNNGILYLIGGCYINNGITGNDPIIYGYRSVATDSTMSGIGTTANPLTLTTNWTTLATLWTAEPTLYDTQATYKVYEYTYGTTLYYRRVYDTYDPATDTFYTTSALTTAICSRALSI